MHCKVSKLDNGLTVITSEMPHVHSISSGVFVNVGSRYEDNTNNGISHMLEHMVFKGTSKRNCFQVNDEISNTGGYINAFTSKEITGYYVKTLKEYFDTGLDVLADIIENATFPDEEFQKEKNVVLQELKMGEDNPEYVVYKNFKSTMHKKQALGQSVIGTTSNIKNFKRDDLFNWIDKNYTGRNMVISVAGNIKHKDVVKKVSKYFLSLKKGVMNKHQKADYVGGAIKKQKDDLQQVKIILGFEAPKLSSKDFYAARILTQILGSGASSRLYTEIREKASLVYNISSFHDSYADTGHLGIASATTPEKMNKLLYKISDEIKKVTDDGVKQEELHRAKNQFKTSMFTSLEDSDYLIEENAVQYIKYGKVLDLEEIEKRLEHVKQDNVLKVARKIFATNPTLSTCGKLDGQMSFSEFKKSLS